MDDLGEGTDGDARLDLRAEAVQERLTTGWLGRRYVHLPSVSSTNDEVSRLAADGAVEGTVVVADAQTRGRGRLGRSWCSPSRENLYFSLLLRPPWRAAELPPLSLVVALAVARGLERLLGAIPTLKWPNDLLCEGRKLSGVLVEMATEGDAISQLVVGVGINVNQRTFADEIASVATSLRLQTGRTFDRLCVLTPVLEQLEAHFDRLYRGEAVDLLQEWQQLAGWIGHEVEVRTGRGVVRGIATGLADGGALLVRDANGQTHQLLAGDLLLR